MSFDLAVGDRLPEREFPVTLTDVVRYAGASGDLNPMHHDADAARRAGMQGAFAHGMYSAGILATAITDAFGVGTLARYDVAFRAQAWLGVPVTACVTVTAAAADSLDLDAQLVNPDGGVVVAATATVTRRGSASAVDGSEAAAPTPSGGLLGTPLTPATVVVERGAVQRFAAAVADDSPAYRSHAAATDLALAGIPAPPTFLFAVNLLGTFDDGQPAAPDGSKTLVELIAALRGGRKGVILHGSQQFVHHAPVHVGDTLDATGFVEKLDEKPGTPEKPGMTVMVVRTDFRSRDAGALLTTSRATYLFRPAKGQ